MKITASLRIGGSFMPLIFVSLGFSFVAWMAAMGPLVIAWPFIAPPVFLMSAFTTSFLKMKTRSLGVVLCTLGIFAALLALLIASVGFTGESEGAFNIDTSSESPLGVGASILAILFLAIGYIGMWRDYLRPSNKLL